jgi:hypothetical protein
MYFIDNKQYSSLEEVSNIYKLPVSTILARLDQKLTLEEAVTTPRWSHTKVAVNGEQFPSIASASRYYGLNPGLVRSRLANGWSIEEALGIAEHKKKITCHNNKGKIVTVQGVEYKSIKEAALAHGFKPRFISNRVNRGLSIEEALEIKPFPTWFVPGKGQKRIQLAQQTKQNREQEESRTGLRLCSCCGEHRPIFNFHGKKEKASRCKDCVSASFLRYKYNISLAEFNRLKEQQRGLCKICGVALEISESSSLRTKNVAVDHCHSTGKVRGLLCSMCNKGLGCFSDNTASLEAAILYLQESRAN